MNTKPKANNKRPSDRRRWIRPVAAAGLIAVLAALIWLPRLNASPATPDQLATPQADHQANDGSLDQARRDGEAYFSRLTR